MLTFKLIIQFIKFREKQKKKEITAISTTFLVKDDIVFGFKNTNPIWHFGIRYLLKLLQENSIKKTSLSSLAYLGYFQ